MKFEPDLQWVGGGSLQTLRLGFNPSNQQVIVNTVELAGGIRFELEVSKTG